MHLRSSGIWVKFFPANRRYHNWQASHQSFTLRVTINPIGHFSAGQGCENLMQKCPLQATVQCEIVLSWNKQQTGVILSSRGMGI